tara:strand:+ start:8942 stop:9685 length:744 start_codon:yes stop_codon:yes gene_type:complete
MLTTKAIFFGAAISAFMMAMPALAERSPVSMGADNRVRYVYYNPVDVVRVDTNLLVNTSIELGQGERIDQVLMGDSEAFDVEVLSSRNVISVKPVVDVADTNMTVYTNQRVFSYRLVAGQAQSEIYRVVMRYPETKPKKKVDDSARYRDTGYVYSGSTDFTPVRVWNDGTNTFLLFGSNQRPSVFAVDSRGYEITTNTAQKGDVVKVVGVPSLLSLRVGDEVVCIKQQGGGLVLSPDDVAQLKSMEF